MKNRVEIIDTKKCDNIDINSFYEVVYKEDNQTKSKIVQKTLDVVKILIYNKDRDAFVLTKQFRPLLYINHPDKSIRYELCGGRCDKEGLSPKEVAIEEVLEETGYRVDDLKEINTFYTTSKMSLFYAEVDDSMIVNSGGGVDYENIDVIYLPISEAKEFLFNTDIPKRPGLAFSFCWFFNWKNTLKNL